MAFMDSGFVRKGLTEAGNRFDKFGKELGESSKPLPVNKESVKFPSNIASFPTFMQYTAYEFTPTGTMATTDSAFGNVGAVQNVLATIYLPALKSDVSEGQGWGTDPANSVGAAAATAGLSAFKGANGGLAGVGAAAKAGAGAAAKATAATFVTGASGLVSSGRGFGVMEQQALKYEGPEIRSLTCTYTLVPRSEDEMRTIQKIINTFRYHSAPSRSDIASATGVGLSDDFNTGVRSYKFPSLFKIKWLSGVEENKWLPKYNTCYCKSVAVEYGDEKFTTFHASAGAPTTYTLTLTFEELDYVTKQTIKVGG
jgi:hypothetical protein